MNGNAKRILSMVISFCILLSAVPMMSITASAVDDEVYITITSPTNGSIEIANPYEAGVVGYTAYLRITPAAGYHMATLTVICGDGTVDTDIVTDSTSEYYGCYCFLCPDSDVTVSATFTEIEYACYIDTDSNGTFNGEDVKYETIAEALGAADTTPRTIRLITDVNENVEIASGQTITLDLNDHVLSGDGTTSVIANYANLTITDTAVSKTVKYFDKNGTTGLWTLKGSGTSNYSVTGGCITGGSDENGGGIYNYDDAALLVKNCSICGNSADASGGGIYNYDGAALLVKNCSICGNSASASGGGIYSMANTKCVLLDTLVAGNVAGTSGGGVDYGAIAACFAAGTQITMGDGSTKNIEDIAVGEYVKSFNHETGKYESNKVFLTYTGDTESRYFTLHFASGTQLSICGCHDLFEQSANRYVAVSEDNCSDHIGKYFYNASTGTWDRLLSVTKSSDTTSYYALYAAKTLNCIANGMLSIPDENRSLDIYTYNADLTVNQEALQADIAKYGIYEFSDCKYITSYELYEAIGVKYYYIIFGKGLATMEEMCAAYNDLFAEEEPTILTAVSAQAPVLAAAPTLLSGGNETPSIDSFVAGVLTIGSGTKIKNNTANFETDNVYLAADKLITLYGTNRTDIDVGVTLANGTGAFTTNGTADDLAYFTADSTSYDVRFVTDHLELVAASAFSASLTINENLNMNLYMTFADGEENAAEAAKYSCKVTFDGAETTPTLTYVSGGKYAATIAEALSYEMTKPVTIKVYYDGGAEPYKTVTTSVQDYFDKLLDKCAADNSGTVSGYNTAALAAFCKAALNYGTEAQKYFSGKSYKSGSGTEDYDVNLSTLANSVLEAADKSLTSVAKPSAPATLRSGEVDGITKYKLNVVLGSETAMKLYLYGDVNGVTVECLNGNDVTGPVNEGSGIYSYKISGLRAFQLSMNYTIEITKGSETATITFSPFIYAATKWDDASLGSLCKAMVNYGNAADAMFGFG